MLIFESTARRRYFQEALRRVPRERAKQADETHIRRNAKGITGSVKGIWEVQVNPETPLGRDPYSNEHKTTKRKTQNYSSNTNNNNNRNNSKSNDRKKRVKIGKILKYTIVIIFNDDI